MTIKITANRVEPEFTDLYVIELIYMHGEGRKLEYVSFAVETDDELEVLYLSSKWAIDNYNVAGQRYEPIDAPMFPYEKDGEDYYAWLDYVPFDVTCADYNAQLIDCNLAYYDKFGTPYKVIYED